MKLREKSIPKYIYMIQLNIKLKKGRKSEVA